MKIKDLSHVNQLVSRLNERVDHYNRLKNILSGSIYTNASVPHSVRIDIGGDHYGNGSYKTVKAEVGEVEYVKRLLRKEMSDEWGLIVSIRAKLRELGVDIDGFEFGSK